MVSTLRRQLASSSIVAGDVVVPLCIFFGMKKNFFSYLFFFWSKRRSGETGGWRGVVVSRPYQWSMSSKLFLISFWWNAFAWRIRVRPARVLSMLGLSLVWVLFPIRFDSPKEDGFNYIYQIDRTTPRGPVFCFCETFSFFTLSFRDGDKHLPLCRKRALLYGRAINNEIVSRRWKKKKRDEERRSVVVVGGRPGKKTHSEGQTPETVRGPIKSQPEAATSCVSSPTNEPIDSLWAPGEKKRHRRMALFFPPSMSPENKCSVLSLCNHFITRIAFHIISLSAVTSENNKIAKHYLIR